MRFLEVVPDGRKQHVFVNVDQIATIGPMPSDLEVDHCRIHMAGGETIQLAMSAQEVLDRIGELDHRRQSW